VAAADAGPADEAAAGVLRGVAPPLPTAIPGNTDTGFALAFAVIDDVGVADVTGGFGVGIGLRLTGGGLGATFGFGGTSSR
jgi:hypothetical protein